MTDDRDAAPPPDRLPQRADDGGLWADLCRLTPARIGLKSAGASLSTGPLLDFQLAHARARDAVHEPLDQARLIADLAGLGPPVVAVVSAATDRQHYLMRPDFGRRLAPGAAAALAPHAQGHANGYDVVFVVTAGLSARAPQTHAAPVLHHVLPGLQAEGLRVAPLVVVRLGRVAVGDAIAAVLRAECVVVLIGERPGLSAPDSMGAYLTWQPHPQTTDADRNCISNIRPEGVGYADAAFRLGYLLRAMRTRRLSGVRLKDDSERVLIGGQQAGAQRP
jgi:ethanolamine ammonia-lyase small subunit